MGTDIHGVFQARTGGKWKDVPTELDLERHYLLFAWLADVRNGFGFAGIPTHTAVEPLSAPRGLPEDFFCVDDMHPVSGPEVLSPWRRKYWAADDKAVWMGDHSHSWLSADEILSAEPPKVLRTGVVTREQFEAWDGKSAPKEWSGGVAGRGILVSEPDEVTSATTHVQIEWFDDTRESFAYFLMEIRRLKELHGEVRFVFGFDS